MSGTDGTPVLAAVGLEKQFRIGRQDIPVLRGVDLELRAGEMVALLGASGAGKSTLLHLLGLLDRPTGGSVLFRGEPVHDLPPNRRAELRHRRIGFVFQFYHLIPELNALENVLLGQMMFRGPLEWLRGRRRVRAEAAALLDRVGLGHRLRHRPAELSGGEKQRVAIARALIAGPDVILADEPTGNLDSATAEGVLALLMQIHAEQRIAFLLVTHNEELAARCARIVRLKDGRIVS
jgi:lipoprotein-releasing system ATP-binding protein